MVRPRYRFRETSVILMLMLAALAAPAFALDYPTRPVKAIVAVGAGGTGDIFMRVLGEELYRLWGQPVITEDYASVDAVDLHVGERLYVELGEDWMRAYLGAGTCGNTVARLISNLQTRFDGALSLTQRGLQEAMALQPPGLPHRMP